MPKENRSASLALQRAKEGLPIQRPSSYPDIVIPKSNLSKARMDSVWANANSGFGSQHATNKSQFFLEAKKREDELSPLYEDDWATRKGCDKPAKDMTRKGISFQHNEDDENEIKTVETLDDILTNDFSWMQVACEAIKFSRLSGGNVTMFNFGGGDLAQQDPVEESQIRDIMWVRNFPSWLAIPLSWYTEFDHPKLGQPEHYQLIFRDPSSSRTVIVHETRLLIMQGRTVTPNTKASNRGWNDSYVQAIYNALRDFSVSSSSASGVMQDFNWFSLGIEGLADKVMHGDQEDTILERIYLARQKLHSGNLSLYDAGAEAMERHGTPVTGLSDLWDRFADIICAAWDIPRSIFFSNETGNLGGSSADADRNNYHDGIASEQENSLRPWLNDFIHFVSLVNGIDDSTVKYDFNPLREKGSKETIEERGLQAATDQIYLQNGVVTPEEIAISRFSESTPNLDTMDLDFEERKASRKAEEFNEENERILQDLEIESQTIDNENKKDEPEEKKEEKKDSVTKDDIREIIESQPKTDDEVIAEIGKKLDSLELVEKIDSLERKIDTNKKEVSDNIKEVEKTIEKKTEEKTFIVGFEKDG